MPNPFSNSVGVTIEENVANAINLNTNISTRNIGMLVARERGVPNEPVLVNSPREDTKIFGGHDPNMFSSYVVESLFNNSGGFPVNLYQTRIVGTGSVASTGVLQAGLTTPLIVITQPTIFDGAGVADSYLLALEDIAVGDEITFNVSGTTNVATVDQPYSFVVSETRATDMPSLVTAIRTALETNLANYAESYTVVEEAGDNAWDNIRITGPVEYAVALSSPQSVNGSVDTLTFYAGRMGSRDVGTWGNDLTVKAYPQNHVNGSPDGYFVEVLYREFLVETYTADGESWADIARQINERSEYIMVVEENTATTLNAPIDITFTGGIYIAPTEADFTPDYEDVTDDPLGMAIFEGENVQILACPEIFTLNFAIACEKFASDNRMFYVHNLPYLATEAIMETFFNGLFTNTQSSIATYLNWAEVTADSSGNKVWIPYLGIALGAGYIRKSGLFNGEVWIPPAGVETASDGVFRITHNKLSESKISRYVRRWRTNVVKFVENVGFTIYSSRTYSTNALYESIHIRLETNWIMTTLLVRNERFLQRIISPALRTDMRTDNLIWFKNIYERGGIEQSVTLDEAVVIETEVSATNRKEVELIISWIPPECLEHLHIRLNRNDGVLIINQ